MDGQQNIKSTNISQTELLPGTNSSGGETYASVSTAFRTFTNNVRNSSSGEMCA